MRNSGAIVLIVAVGVIAYFNSLSGEFIWDDRFLVSENKHIESFSYAGQVFKEDLFHMASETTGYYRPIQVVSYMVDFFLWGRYPFGYHITSLAFQILNSIIVFCLCMLILGDRLKSLFVACVFCVHPAFVPVVGYVSGRADLLGLFFGLLTIYLALKHIIRGGGGAVFFLGVPFYILAVLSKEYYVVTPLFILLFLWAFDKEFRADRRTVIFLLVTGLVAGAYAFLRATILNFHQEMSGIAQVPFMSRAAVFPYVLTRYILTLFFPVNVGMEKKLVYSSLAEPRFVFCYITPLLLMLAIRCFLKTRRRRELFWLCWFLAGILPVANLFFPLKLLWADHWAYMPSIGLFALLALMADRARGWIRSERIFKRAKVVLSVLFIVFLAGQTIRENRYWRNEQVFFQRTLEKSPRSARARYNAGRVFEEKGDYKKALELYNAAIEEIGAAGRKSGARAQYLHARGLLYRKMGDMVKARRDFEMAVKNSPSVPMYRNDLGAIYAEFGMFERARREWKKTLELDPDNELARKNLEVVSGGEGIKADAGR